MGITGVGELDGDVELNEVMVGETIIPMDPDIWVVINAVALAVVVAVAVVVTPNDTNIVAVEFAGSLAMPLPLKTVNIIHFKMPCDLRTSRRYQALTIGP